MRELQKRDLPLLRTTLAMPYFEPSRSGQLAK
jgi:hypothetical protein